MGVGVGGGRGTGGVRRFFFFRCNLYVTLKECEKFSARSLPPAKMGLGSAGKADRRRAQAKIAIRIDRVATGNFGDR
jgi:hypothetical protein